jgi:hypothetical protein
MKNSRKWIMVVGAFVLTASMQVCAQDRTDCVVKTKGAWAEPCDKCQYYKEGFRRSFDETFSLELQNTCSEAVEVKTAVQEKDGHWRIFPVKVLDPQASMRAFACHGTGRYLYWVRALNDLEVLLPTDQEIVSNYK